MFSSPSSAEITLLDKIGRLNEKKEEKKRKQNHNNNKTPCAARSERVPLPRRQEVSSTNCLWALPISNRKNKVQTSNDATLHTS